MNYLGAFIYGTTLFHIHEFFPTSSLVISFVLIVLLAFLRRKEKTLIYIFIIIVISISGFYYAKLRHVPMLSISDIAGKTLEIQGIATSEAIALNAEHTVFSQRVDVKSLENLKEMRLIIHTPLSLGKTYHIKVQIPKDAYTLNPGSKHGLITGHVLSVKEAKSSRVGFFEELRIQLNDFIKENFSYESASFLMSIITGERSLLTKNTKDAFNATGLTHILSISGAHFGLLWFILFKFFKFLMRIVPYNVLVRLTLYITPSQIAAVLSIPFMIAYLAISDMSIPSIRAFIMIAFFLFGLLIYRKGFWLNTLLFAAVVVILIQPEAILDLSFQLSFIAVLCIGMVTEQRLTAKEKDKGQIIKQDSIVETRKPSHLKSLFIAILRYCSDALKISLAATIGTAPLVAYYFHYFSLVSPLTNLIITPFIGFVILPLSLLSSFIFFVLGVFPLSCFIDVITNFILNLIRHIAQWDFVETKISGFPLILLIMFYTGVLVCLIIEQKSRSLEVQKFQKEESINPYKYYCASVLLRFCSKELLLLTTIAVIPIIFYAGSKLLEPKGISITYLDVGQGDSAVVELPDKRIIVIDTGRRGFQTGGFLRYRGIKNIDAIILSHGQSDHSGGIFYLIKNFNVKEIWDNGKLIYPKEFKELRIRKLQRGDVIEGNGYRITVLHPYNGFYTMYSSSSDENNDSLVFVIHGNKNSFLFTGDIEKEAEDNLVHLKRYIKSNVMKVPHHGSRSSASEIFFRAVSPEIAVISVGRKNTYGHPHTETLGMLSNAKIYRTDIDGAIGIQELSDGRLKVKVWREFQMCKANTIIDEIMNLKRLFMIW